MELAQNNIGAIRAGKWRFCNCLSFVHNNDPINLAPSSPENLRGLLLLSLPTRHTFRKLGLKCVSAGGVACSCLHSSLELEKQLRAKVPRSNNRCCSFHFLSSSTTTTMTKEEEKGAEEGEGGGADFQISPSGVEKG